MQQHRYSVAHTLTGRYVLRGNNEKMDEILVLIESPIWWFSTVFIGLFLNIAASYLKPLIEKLFAKTVNKWTVASQKRASFRQAQINFYSSSYEQLTIGHIEENHKKMEVIYCFALAASAFAMGANFELNSTMSTVGLGTGLLFSLGGLKATISHGAFSLIVAQARVNLLKKDQT
ncbi:hypothetical protein ACPV3U_21865 [Vibrio rotiferianus]|uniref:hypothetical protein n=1 Tax=Vibrio rotiferianus TaxID=190895 RepID=UPI00406A9E53